MKLRVCFLGGTRYSRPLNETSKKKFLLLAELGKIFVIGFSHKLRPYCFKEHAHFYLMPQLPLPFLRYIEMFIIGIILTLWLIFRYSVQVLIAQSPYEGFIAAIAKKIANWFERKVVLIIESHGDFEESVFLQRYIYLAKFYRFLMNRIANFALKHADLLRAVSNSTRSQLERWVPGKPICQFPTWTDIEAFFEAGTNCQKDNNTIIYVGVLIPRKGVHLLINAFAQIVKNFPEAILKIVGKSENEKYTRLLKEQVTKLRLSRHIVFIEAIPQQELARHVAQACALVLPSLSEGLPRVVFEAMACGTPVIGSRVSGIPEIIEDGVTGFLVPPGDVDALAERIRWVLSHPEEAKQVGRRAREFAQRFFSPQVYQRGYAQLFRMAENILREGRHYAPIAL